MFSRKKLKPKFLIMSQASQFLAHATQENSPTESQMELLITEGNPDNVMRLDAVLLLSSSLQTVPLRLCRPIKQLEGKRIIIEPFLTLGENARKTLRLPVDFPCFLYPLTPKYKGRIIGQAKDLSCGGVRFTATKKLDFEDEFEVVIPVISESYLVLTCKIIRVDEQDGEYMYVARFVDIIHDEENALQEALFNAQLSQANLFHH